jgi:hypothetical protein
MALGGDNGKRQEAGRGADEGSGHGVDDKDKHNSGNGGSSERRGRYNPGHERGRLYGGYARGWQRHPYRGYRYSGSQFKGGIGRGGGDHGTGHSMSHVHAACVPVLHQVVTGEESSRRGATEPQSQEDLRMQKSGKAEAKPHVPEVFTTEKASKAKVDEGGSGEGGRSGEGDDNPFCIHCYKPGHGKLVCTTKLRCNICGSNEHMTGKCPILKQPRLLAHPYGYDVSGLGFYHIPHVPITPGKSDNRTTLVTVQGGVISIPQLVTELSRLLPEKWLWDATQQDDNSFIVPFPSRGGLQRSMAFGKADIKELGVSLLFEEWKEEE